MKRNLTGGTYGVVHTITMDDLLELPVMEEFKTVFIKMDIEGFEARALTSSHKLFTTLDVRGFLMEWVFHSGTESGRTIVDFMKTHDYEPFTFEKYGPRLLNFSNHKLWPHDVLWLPKN